MLRVLYLINHAGKAGTETYVRNLVNAYEGKCAKCFMAYNEEGLLAEQMREKGIPVFKIEMSKPYDIVAAYRLAKICRKNKIDIVHTQYPRENYIAILSKLFYPRIKVIYTCHLTLEVNSRAWFIANRLFTRFNKRILSVCNFGKELMVKNGVIEDKIKVIYNGVHPDEIRKVESDVRGQLGIDDETFVITTLARYSPEKGLPYLVRSIKKLSEITGRKFVCLIAGDGNLFDEIHEQIKSLGLEKNILQLGFRKDVDAILSASDIFINSAKCNEALSFAILEALGKGLPVIATAVGGNGDIINDKNDCGFLVKYDDDMMLANAIKKLMDDKELYNKFSQNAVLAIKNVFNLEIITREIYNEYIN